MYLYPALSPHYHQSQIDMDEPDNMAAFARFHNVSVFEANLVPGDVLYVPRTLQHRRRDAALSCSLSLSCSLTHIPISIPLLCSILVSSCHERQLLGLGVGRERERGGAAVAGGVLDRGAVSQRVAAAHQDLGRATLRVPIEQHAVLAVCEPAALDLLAVRDLVRASERLCGRRLPRAIRALCIELRLQSRHRRYGDSVHHCADRTRAAGMRGRFSSVPSVSAPLTESTRICSFAQTGCAEPPSAAGTAARCSQRHRAPCATASRRARDWPGGHCRGARGMGCVATTCVALLSRLLPAVAQA